MAEKYCSSAKIDSGQISDFICPWREKTADEPSQQASIEPVIENVAERW